ncbi:Peptidase [Aphelenchoides fujianensis]|nr:Peptidase [Aphelenchoides fujianensis]
MSKLDLIDVHQMKFEGALENMGAIVFSADVYLGGASMLRMTEAAVGPDVFLDALRLYLSEHMFGSADHLDLVRAFEEAAGNRTLCGDLTIREFLLDFLTQPGHPIVGVQLRGRTLGFAQSSSPSPADSASNSSAVRWNLPLFLWNPRDGVETTVWLLKNNSVCADDQAAFERALRSPALVLNRRGLTYARFVYPNEMLAALLREERLDDANLQGLMQDANQTAVALRFFVAAVRSGRPVGPEVLQMGFGLLEVAEGILESTNERELFRQLKVDLVTRLYRLINPEPQKSGERARTDFLLPQAVRLNVLDSRAQAARTWTELPADLRSSIFCFAVVAGDQQAAEFALAYWTRLLNQFPVYTYFKQEINNVEAGLKCAEDPRLLTRLLQQAAAHGRQDFAMQIARNPAAGDVSFEFARRLLQQLMSAFNHQLTGEQRNALVQVLDANIKTRLATIRDYTRFLFDVQVPQTPPVWSDNEVKPPVRDVAYDLAFRPQLPAPHLEIEWGKEGTFDANSTISFVTTSPTDRIELNAHRQAIGRVFATIDGSTLPVRFERDFQRTFLTVFFGRQLPTGTSVRLTFEYAGFLATPQSNGGVIVVKHFNSITKNSRYSPLVH